MLVTKDYLDARFAHALGNILIPTSDSKPAITPTSLSGAKGTGFVTEPAINRDRFIFPFDHT
jgi:hypothetical protein